MICHLCPRFWLIAVLANSLLWGQSNKASISGLVRDANANPIADAVVVAQNTKRQQAVLNRPECANDRRDVQLIAALLQRFPKIRM